MRGYLDVCGGDVADALALYRWNTQISGAYWETLGHVEIVLRNVLAGPCHRANHAHPAKSATTTRSGVVVFGMIHTVTHSRLRLGSEDNVWVLPTLIKLM